MYQDFLTYVIYIFLNLILFFTFVKVGQIENQRDKWNNKIYLWAIVSFTLILGLRYGRGADYIHYQAIFLRGLGYSQPGFEYLNDGCRSLGFNEFTIFVAYSFIFIFCAGIILKYYHAYAKFLIPLFLCSYLPFEEWFIRQALGYSFIFITLRYLFDNSFGVNKRIIICLLSAICACSIHSANVFTIVMLVCVYLICKKPFSYIITIPIFLFSTFYFQYHADLGWMGSFLQIFMGHDSRFDEYIKGSDDWFSNSAMHESYYRKGVVKFFQTMGECAYLYVGYKIFSLSTKKGNMTTLEKSLICLFNVSVVGVILGQMFFSMEIPKRIAQTIYMFWCFPLAYIVSFAVKDKFRYINKWLYIPLMWFLYEYIKIIFFRIDGVYTFVWDVI